MASIDVHNFLSFSFSAFCLFSTLLLLQALRILCMERWVLLEHTLIVEDIESKRTNKRMILHLNIYGGGKHRHAHSQSLVSGVQGESSLQWSYPGIWNMAVS